MQLLNVFTDMRAVSGARRAEGGDSAGQAASGARGSSCVGSTRDAGRGYVEDVQAGPATHFFDIFP